MRSVARWAHGTPPRRQAEDRLLELKAVVDLLSQVLEDEPATIWLRTPSPDLGYDKPIDLLREGQYRTVIASLLAIAEGSPPDPAVRGINTLAPRRTGYRLGPAQGASVREHGETKGVGP